ncbi:CreA protein [Nitrosomonas ureae]|uniref:CreA protein n=2 Tax=Nitrosomonas ureae TaxID=44577 RepID=A0A0S3AJ31_9PROT|nr:CreA family protein [Nitrosomonas ureae]ALQ51177.1 protein CreA [Nitrosomonas ureae]PTQ81958.1 CreA protein [Nitrosomonas ureae]PXX13409.1 CreA protein [Nitrosomonas ureae]SDU06471.1 CreA protein [Nitrosomonas ureae]SEQ41699.1 CreA protein [Nitrosomonas ureae]
MQYFIVISTKSLLNALLIGILMLQTVSYVMAEKIGSVSTKFKVLGANDKIVVEAFDDPDIAGATCYLSRAKTGGVSGMVGIAEDTSDASIACRQIGPISLPEKVKNGDEDGAEVFKKSTSLLFKSLQVVRFYDAKRNVLVYLTYSDRIIEGSPKNSISIIPITPWH